MSKVRYILSVWVTSLVLVTTMGCGSDESSKSAHDMSASETDMGENDPQRDMTTESQFEVGYNVVYQNTPDSYTPMSDGTTVPLIWGVQGSWMVVLAFRTQNLIEGLFDIRADIGIDGSDAGDIWLEFQETFPGGDGWDYYYNLFLAIDLDDPPPEGTPATIHVLVEDEDGNVAEETHEVFIGETVGGP